MLGLIIGTLVSLVGRFLLLLRVSSTLNGFLGVFTFLALKIDLLKSVVDGIVFDDLTNNFSNIFFVSKLFK